MGQIKFKTEISRRGDKMRHWKISIEGPDAERNKIEKVRYILPPEYSESVVNVDDKDNKTFETEADTYKGHAVESQLFLKGKSEPKKVVFVLNIDEDKEVTVNLP